MGHHKGAHHMEPDYKVGKMHASESAQAERHEKRDSEEGRAAHPRQEELKKKLTVLRSASTDAFSELRTGVNHAFGELKGSVHKAVHRFESALRPQGKDTDQKDPNQAAN